MSERDDLLQYELERLAETGREMERKYGWAPTVLCIGPLALARLGVDDIVVTRDYFSAIRNGAVVRAVRT